MTDELLDALVERVAARAAEIVLAELDTRTSTSPYMSVPEAAEYLRTTRRRVDDLLAAGRLTRVKEGRRTLVLRAELERHLRADDPGSPTARRPPLRPRP